MNLNNAYNFVATKWRIFHGVTFTVQKIIIELDFVNFTRKSFIYIYNYNNCILGSYCQYQINIR